MCYRDSFNSVNSLERKSKITMNKVYNKNLNVWKLMLQNVSWFTNERLLESITYCEATKLNVYALINYYGSFCTNLIDPGEYNLIDL